MEIMKKYISEIIAFAVGVLITSMAFIIYNNHQLKQEITTIEKPVIKTETKVITKTDTIYKVITKPRYITQTIIRTDTIRANTAIDFIQREYYTNIQTDTVTGQIKAVVSGYNPSLDTLKYNIHIPTKTITNTIEIQTTKYKQKHWNFSVGVGAGYGLISKRVDVFVGGIVGYSF